LNAPWSAWRSRAVTPSRRDSSYSEWLAHPLAHLLPVASAPLEGRLPVPASEIHVTASTFPVATTDDRAEWPRVTELPCAELAAGAIAALSFVLLFAPYLARAGVVTVPLRIGGGSRLKIWRR
jgi:hypothetical protein